MKKKLLKIIGIVFSLMLGVLCMTVHTFGHAPIDTERDTSLTLTFGKGETNFSDVKFQLYHIADVSTDADYILTADFAKSAMTLQAENEGDWQKKVDMLTAYIDKNKIVPVAEKATDADGVVTFSGLQTGLYLVVGEAYSAETEIYYPASFVVALPQLAVESDTWDYEVVANVKYTVSSEQLPQTGLLWWPAWLLIPGSILLIAGVVSLRRSVKKSL